MPANPPENMPRITSHLLYEDVASALDWLTETFGFQERMRIPGADGNIMHAEIGLHDGLVMMGQPPEPDYKNPKRLGCVTQSLYVYVDEHFKHTQKVGATILAEPEDQFWGDRYYRVEDLEGHHWTFAQHTRDIAPEDMQIPG